MRALHTRLLDHPFYQAWTRGEVREATLAEYHHAYAEFIRRIPSYWQDVVLAFGVTSPLTAEIIREETEHIHLWNLWGAALPNPRGRASLQEAIEGFNAFNPSALLGALQAFEVQQPEVARTKKEGLLRHYRLHEADLRYFDEHLAEEKHIAFGSRLAATHAHPADFEEGFHLGAGLVYRSLDQFVGMDA
jgi:pyrroloquinoline-quinone synthase